MNINMLPVQVVVAISDLLAKIIISLLIAIMVAIIFSQFADGCFLLFLGQ